MESRPRFHTYLRKGPIVAVEAAVGRAAVARLRAHLGHGQPAGRTGFSSLSHLKRFQMDTLKIDQSFVRNLTTDAGDAGIVSAVISMGKSLHMRVVAEGIETPEQLAFLQEQNCPEGQGYYFSQPLTVGEFTELLGRSVVEPRSPDGRLTRKSALKHVAVNTLKASLKPSALLTSGD